MIRAPAGGQMAAVPVSHVGQALQKGVVDVVREGLLLVMLVVLNRRHAWLRNERRRDAPFAAGVGLSVDVVDGRRRRRPRRMVQSRLKI